MRRNSTHYRTLTPYILFIVAILYESLASMTLFMSPLLGVGFYYIVHYSTHKERYSDFILIIFYTLYVEINRGLVPLSFLFFTLIFYKSVFHTMQKYIHCHICIPLLYVTLSYLGYFLFNLFLTYTFNLPLATFSAYYFVYILTDLLIIGLFL